MSGDAVDGRIGRLLIALLMVAWDLLPQPVLYLSAFFERYRAEYYEALLAVSARSAWREWLEFFLRGVAGEAGDAAAKACRLQDLQTEWRARLAGARASGLAFRLLDGLFAAPVLTIPQAREALGVTYRTAKMQVERLVELGILEPVNGKKHGKVYLARGILAALGEPVE